MSGLHDARLAMEHRLWAVIEVLQGRAAFGGGGGALGLVSR